MYDKRMKKKKTSDDVNVIAFEITKAVTNPESGESVRANELADQAIRQIEQRQISGKNPAAVALGRLGGLKGGRARDKKLSAKRKIEIASKAAKARWKTR